MAWPPMPPQAGGPLPPAGPSPVNQAQVPMMPPAGGPPPPAQMNIPGVGPVDAQGQGAMNPQVLMQLLQIAAAKKRAEMGLPPAPAAGGPPAGPGDALARAAGPVGPPPPMGR